MPAQAPSLAYFEALLTSSDALIARISGSAATPAEKQSYYNRVREIFALLAQAHAAVADTAGEIRGADTVEEALKRLKLLDQMGLASALRAQDLCDKLECAGRAFRPLLDARQDLDAGDKRVLDELTTGLEHREAETAMLYQRELADLRQLVWTESRLEVIKRVTGETANRLVLQKAKFDTFVRKIDHLKDQLA
jgi:single-stranded DNA-specific DHH superfamily exonuclease